MFSKFGAIIRDCSLVSFVYRWLNSSQVAKTNKDSQGVLKII